jgi:hypothetical protein
METFELKSILEIDAVLETSDLDKCCRASLLNTEQENFNIIEKIVYDLAMNYFHEKNIIYNKDDYYIEFWCKSNGNWNIFNYLHPLHYDKDEYIYRSSNKMVHPIVATITYLNDNNCPTIITNINIEEEQSGNFQKNPELILSIPKKLKHVRFNSSYKHGAINIFNTGKPTNIKRQALMFNIWNIKPMGIQYYENNENKIYNKKNNLFDIIKINNKIYNNTTLTNEIMKEIIYRKKNIKLIINELIANNNISIVDMNTTIIK